MAQGWEEINGVRVRRFPVSSYISRLFVYLAGNYQPVLVVSTTAPFSMVPLFPD